MYDQLTYPNINRLWAGLVVNTLAKKGANTFFTSPGLRNAPLLSAALKNKKAKVHSGIDERGMSYRALGFSKSTGRPAVLICTSGTALANYLPAVIESYQTNTPLIILSADRPKKLVDWGDNQSILQPGLFGNYLRSELSLPLPSEETPPQDIVDQVCRCMEDNKFFGPIHINMPFDEPLDSRESHISNTYRAKADAVKLSELMPAHDKTINFPQIDKNKKTLIVVGPTPEYKENKNLKNLLSNLSLPIILDIGSGLKFSNLESNRILPSFEHPEIRSLLEKNKPELIIHLGGRLVSKHYYSFLRNNPDIDVLLVGNEGLYTHPANSPRWEFKSNLDNFCSQALDNKYFADCVPYIFDASSIVGKKEDIIEKGPFSFPVITKKIVETIPTGSNLYLGNSTTIRSFDAFASTKTHSKNINVLSHRGASGIEGFNAAALGSCEETNRTTILVHGDISFMHDLNSLIMYKNKKIPLINIVVNNGGGGIFKHLPIAKDEETMPLITTEHDLHYKSYSEWLGINYISVDRADEFENALMNAIQSQDICLIEAKVDQKNNEKMYELLKTLKL